MILMLAPGPNLTFGAMPSGASYVSDDNSLIKIANNSAADQLALQEAGCSTLTPFGGWGTFSFDTIDDLYAADLASSLVIAGQVGFPKFSTCQVMNDPTPANNGTWYKSGDGNGSGNWSYIALLASSGAVQAQAAAVVASTQAATAVAQTAVAIAQAGIATAQASIATAAANTTTGAAVAAAIQNTLSTTPVALPYEVSAITLGTAGSGATVSGEFALTISGGPPGHTAFVTVSGGSITAARIGNRGISTSNTAPTYTLPTIAGLTGATAPTATVSTIAVGRMFYAPSSDGKMLLAWGNNAGSLATAPFGGTQLSVPTQQPIQDYDTLNPDLVNTVAVVGSDGYVIATLPSVNQPLTGQVYDTLAYPGQTIMVGSDGYILAVIDSATLTALNAEITTARGSRTALDLRLSGELTAYGLQRGPYKRPWALHRWRRDWASVLYGLDSPVTRSIIAAVGDSYSTTPYYWTYWLKWRLDRTSGQNGGIGWCGFGDPGGGIGINGNVYVTGNGNVVVTKTGSWLSNYGTAPAQVHPALSDAYSSTVGDRYTIAVTKNDRPALSDVILHYGGGESGILRYRYNGGAWSTLSLTGSGVQLTSLTGFPTGTANFTLDVEVDPTNTGTVRLYGVDLVSATTGTVLHKLGATGQKISQHAAASATPSWATALASLAPSVVTLGTPINDRNGGFSPTQYATNVQIYFTNVRAVLPYAELVAWFPGEILAAYPYATHMREYRKACEPLLDVFDGLTLLDFQYLLPGDGNPNAYGPSTAFPVLDSGLVHPSSPYGARVYEDGFARLLLN